MTYKEDAPLASISDYYPSLDKTQEEYKMSDETEKWADRALPHPDDLSDIRMDGSLYTIYEQLYPESRGYYTHLFKTHDHAVVFVQKCKDAVAKNCESQPRHSPNAEHSRGIQYDLDKIIRRKNDTPLNLDEFETLETISAALTAQQHPDVNAELLGALKQAIEFAKETRKSQSVSITPEADFWIEKWGFAIARAEQKCVE